MTKICIHKNNMKYKTGIPEVGECFLYKETDLSFNKNDVYMRVKDPKILFNSIEDTCTTGFYAINLSQKTIVWFSGRYPKRYYIGNTVINFERIISSNSDGEEEYK